MSKFTVTQPNQFEVDVEAERFEIKAQFTVFTDDQDTAVYVIKNDHLLSIERTGE